MTAIMASEDPGTIPAIGTSPGFRPLPVRPGRSARDFQAARRWAEEPTVASVETAPGELNALAVRGRRLLLVATGGHATHLADESADGDRRAPVPGSWLVAGAPGYVSTIERYDTVALTARIWSCRSLCGLTWQAMAAGVAGPLRRDQEVQLAPTCRRCLASARTPPRVQPAELHDPRLDLGRHLMRTRQRLRRTIDQPGDPVGRVAAQPAMHRLPRHPLKLTEVVDTRVLS
jgi:hypothetical protein